MPDRDRSPKSLERDKNPSSSDNNDESYELYYAKDTKSTLMPKFATQNPEILEENEYAGPQTRSMRLSNALSTSSIQSIPIFTQSQPQNDPKTNISV
ncbi:hypothetical protein JTB14_009996 [Gonioctena quinquepunctata]|nr:hypothetical protein JTB14_009996 [Gonioctena quinquepunctata]